MSVPLAWVPISPRRASARLLETIVSLTFIAAYASKLDAVEGSFDDDLPGAVNSVPSGVKPIALGPRCA